MTSPPCAACGVSVFVSVGFGGSSVQLVLALTVAPPVNLARAVLLPLAVFCCV